MGGGVLIISHNKEFCDGVATEKWIMQGGRLRIEGESVDTSEGKDDGNAGPDEVYDGAGNKIEVKKNAALSDKDKKKHQGLGEEAQGGQEEEDLDGRGDVGDRGQAERTQGSTQGISRSLQPRSPK